MANENKIYPAGSPKKSAGFSLLEIILASALFALIAGAFGTAAVYGRQTALLAAQRTHAAFLAEEGIAAVRNLRDENFSNLQNGNFGLVINNHEWELNGSSDQTGIFSRTVTISDNGNNEKNVEVNVTWGQNHGPAGRVFLSTLLSDWKDN